MSWALGFVFWLSCSDLSGETGEDKINKRNGNCDVQHVCQVSGTMHWLLCWGRRAAKSRGCPGGSGPEDTLLPPSCASVSYLSSGDNTPTQTVVGRAQSNTAYMLPQHPPQKHPKVLLSPRPSPPHRRCHPHHPALSSVLGQPLQDSASRGSS